MISRMKIELTAEEKMALKAQHRQTHGVCDRIRCVLLASDGGSTAMIAQSQLIHETTVLRHLQDDILLKKLSSTNGGSQEHLCVENSDELKRFLTETTQVTTNAIIAHVKEKYRVSYSVPGMNQWLHRNGFTYKKLAGIPHKFDPEKQPQFIEK